VVVGLLSGSAAAVVTDFMLHRQALPAQIEATMPQTGCRRFADHFGGAPGEAGSVWAAGFQRLRLDYETNVPVAGTEALPGRPYPTVANGASALSDKPRWMLSILYGSGLMAAAAALLAFRL
jgi:hypothetical protein